MIFRKKKQNNEALSILKKIFTLEFAFMICMWTPILKRFNATSLALQSVSTELCKRSKK